MRLNQYFAYLFINFEIYFKTLYDSLLLKSQDLNKPKDFFCISSCVVVQRTPDNKDANKAMRNPTMLN